MQDTLKYLRDKNIHYVFAPLNDIVKRPDVSLVPVAYNPSNLSLLGISELGAKGYSLDSLEGPKSCDWLSRHRIKAMESGNGSSSSNVADNVSRPVGIVQELPFRTSARRRSK